MPQPSSPSSSPEGAAHATLRSAAGLLALLEIPGIGEKTALRQALFSAEADPFLAEHRRLWTQALAEAEAEVERCREQGIAVVSIFEDSYPARLRTIVEPPLVLFVRGELEALDYERMVTLAGSSEPTDAALAAAENIATALAAAGWVVVGGLRKGIETAAHRSAASQIAPTVAVLSAGLGQISPKYNQGLAEAILGRGGALLSTYRMALKPTRNRALGRNRVLTGLSAALVLVQASREDGAMYTVRGAAEQGRPLFVAESRASGYEDEGLRVLLSVPAQDLDHQLPAWKSSTALCARLGDRPLAQAVAPGETKQLLAKLEHVIEAEHQHPAEPKWWPWLKDKVGESAAEGGRASLPG